MKPRVYIETTIPSYLTAWPSRDLVRAAHQQIPALEQTDRVIALAERILKEVPLPAKAGSDAFHIAHAAVHRMNYLLTWNCRHIANAVLRPGIVRICEEVGGSAPLICTPLELLPEELQPQVKQHD